MYASSELLCSASGICVGVPPIFSPIVDLLPSSSVGVTGTFSGKFPPESAVLLLACLDRESKKQGIVAIRPYKAVVITIHDKEFLFKYYTVLPFFVLKTQSCSVNCHKQVNDTGCKL